MALGSSYQSGWRDLRRRDLIVLTLIAGWLPIGGALILTLDEGTAIPLPLLYQACLVAAVIHKMLFRCPRCGRFFYIGLSSYQNPFASRCPHCNLRRGT